MNAEAYPQFLFLGGLSSRQLYDLPHGKAFHCDPETESLPKGQHGSHMLLHARGRKKSAVYYTKNHFIILRWKFPSGFSVTVKKESLVGRATTLILKSSANWCLPTNRKSQWCGLQTLNLESDH